VNVTVFGAGGRTGRSVIDHSLARGHAVTAVVRRPPDPPLHPGVRIVTGDARDATAVAIALEAADAVVSAMGPASGTQSTDYSDAIAALIQAMEAGGPSRLVVTANARVFDDRPLDGPYAGVSREHRRALATLLGSGLAWTVVAAPMLSDAEATGRYEATPGHSEAKDDEEIPRDAFARIVLDALDRGDWIGRAVGVAGPPLSGA
jgi:putative NADH-flavin reductase